MVACVAPAAWTPLGQRRTTCLPRAASGASATSCAGASWQHAQKLPASSASVVQPLKRAGLFFRLPGNASLSDLRDTVRSCCRKSTAFSTRASSNREESQETEAGAASDRSRPQEPQQASSPQANSSDGMRFSSQQPPSPQANPTQQQQPTPSNSGKGPPTPPVEPTPRDALNWFCISLILLISLSDFTPLGAALAASSSSSSPAPWALAAVQWLFFVAPTLSWALDCKFDVRETFKLKPCSAKDLALGALGGFATWGLVSALLALKTGGGVGPDLPIEATTLSPGGGDIFSDLLWYAVSPAAAEEILFRGFVLSALSTGFGRVDSVMLAAGMFGAFHLSLPQLFPTLVLGIAAGFTVQATGSVFPAVALHFANNAAAILFGGLT